MRSKGLWIVQISGEGMEISCLVRKGHLQFVDKVVYCEKR